MRPFHESLPAQMRPGHIFLGSESAGIDSLFEVTCMQAKQAGTILILLPSVAAASSAPAAPPPPTTLQKADPARDSAPLSWRAARHACASLHPRSSPTELLCSAGINRLIAKLAVSMVCRSLGPNSLSSRRAASSWTSRKLESCCGISHAV